MEKDIEKVIQHLREQKQTLTFAESCTGGLLSSRVTSLPGVSDVFMGSVVTYSNRMKREVLGVSAPVLSTLGAVSRPVALQMARGVKVLTDTHWAVSITGIAGPAGGTDTKPVGTVCFAIVGPGFEWSSKELFTGSRIEVQQSSAKFAIEALEKAFLGELN